MKASANSPIRLGLLGAHGRMGQWVQKLVEGEFSSRFTLVSAPVRGESLEPLLDCEVVIDFSLPEAMTSLATLALTRASHSGGPELPVFVVASTGWTREGETVLSSLAQKTLLIASGNFSTGVLALLEILKEASPLLRSLGYQAVVTETHHIHKKDAPSGTAKMILTALNPEAPASVPCHAIRGGEIIGDHSVTFYGKADHLVLSHSAQDRSLFARGALDVAGWLAQKRCDGVRAGRIEIRDYLIGRD